MKLLPLFLLLATFAQAGEAKLSKDAKTSLERYFTAEMVYAHTVFPMGMRGLTLNNGIISPAGFELQLLVSDAGAACKPGDIVLITKVLVKDNTIRFEINGGPQQKQKWYQRVSVAGTSGEVPIVPTDARALNAHGSYVDVVFPGKYVPDLKPEDIKIVLKQVLDFDATTQLDAFLNTVPDKAKDAIRHHRVLVGMNSDMVSYAMGKPTMKTRELVEGTTTYYEEWIYGVSPATVTFVRYGGTDVDIVTRVEIMKVGQPPEVRTELELTLPLEDEKSAPVTAHAPTLRRPGEQQ